MRRGRRSGTWRHGVAALGASALLLASAAPAIAKPKIKGKPTISGVFQVGATLTATAQWEDGSPTWTWLSCPGNGLPSCSVIAGASGSSYVVAPADEQKRLRVQLVVRGNGDDNDESDQAVSNATPKIVAGRRLPPRRAPIHSRHPRRHRRRRQRHRRRPRRRARATPPRPPAFDLGNTATAPPPAATTPTAPAATGDTVTSRMMRPFPVVRIRGRVTSAGVRVTALTVRAPRGARIVARCSRGACPRRRFTTAGSFVHLRPFERVLRAGVRLEITVTRRGIHRQANRDRHPPRAAA